MKQKHRFTPKLRWKTATQGRMNTLESFESTQVSGIEGNTSGCMQLARLAGLGSEYGAQF